MRDLTVRELEVVHLVAHGLSNREVGARLFIAENTVKSHLRRAGEALGCRMNRVRIVMLCVQREILLFDQDGRLQIAQWALDQAA